MRYTEIVICTVLLSFMAGLLCETQCHHEVTDNAQRRPESVYSTFSPPKPTKPLPSSPTEETALKPCSKSHTMPCDMSPPNPLKESLDAKVEASTVFTKGEGVTCIYPGVFYHEACSKDQCLIDGAEFIKNIAVECKVLDASEVYNGSEQQIKVNCLKDLETKWSATQGNSLVKGHKLNATERWFFSDDCYHFTQHTTK